MSRLALFAILGVCVLHCAHAQTRNKIDLINNGYETLLIAIHESIAENLNIVTRLQQIFSDASNALYRATRNRAFFRNITILIPPTWTNRPEYQPLTWETFSSANVIVDKPHAVHGNNPYVSQIGTCGMGGDYMHFTEEYLANQSHAEQNWGPSDKVIVHEWGHLRWGLFDEYSQPGESDFTFNWGTLEPTRCTSEIKGTARDSATGGSCTFNPSIQNYDTSCRFIPQPDANTATAKASMMYKQFLPQVYEFCDSAFVDNPNLAHNIDASSKQNDKCAGQSSWEVMRQHDDFAQAANPPRSLTASEIIPSIRLVQHINKPAIRRCMLLDVSGSMGYYGRREKMLQSASDFIYNVIETGSELGIVSFSSTAQTLMPMTEVKDNFTRAQIVTRLPLTLGGSTAIGLGVLECISLLEANSKDPSGGIILLLTDGEENIAPMVAAVTPNVKAKNVKVDGIALGPKAEINIGSLAATSSGMNFYDTENALSTEIFESYVFSAVNRGQGESLVVIVSDSFYTGSGSHSGTAIIDATANYRTTFNFYYPAGVSLTVALSDSRGVVYNSASPSYIYVNDVTMHTIRFSIPGLAQIGTWTYSVVGSSSGEVRVSVKARPNPLDNTEPITVSGRLGQTFVTYDPQGYVPVFAEVTQGYRPLTNVPVKATVSCNGAADVDVPLFDSGSGPDSFRHDGIYSGYFLASNMTKNGRYGLRFTVVSTGGDVSTIVGASRAAAVNVAGNGNLTGNSTGSFQRVANGGMLQVNGYSPSSGDVHPPSRIDDLKLAYASYDDYLVIIRWTAVGDDLMAGNATRYELKVSENNTELLFDFANTAPLPSSYPLRCPLNSPASPGQVETCTLRLPDRGPHVMYYFAIVAHDDAGNVADTSNILPLGLLKEDPALSSSDKLTISRGVLIGIGTIGLAALLASVVCGFMLLALIKRRKKRKTADCVPGPERNPSGFSTKGARAGNLRV